MSNETRNEGEGSRTAAKDYEERTREFMQSGALEDRAKAAVAALDEAEIEELHEAEEEGRRHSHGEDPQVHRDK